MFSHFVQSRKSVAQPVDLQLEALQEQLALKRVKELSEEARSAAPNAHELALEKGWLWQSPASLWVALFRRAALSRQLEPGQAPAEWNELEELRARRAMELR